MFFDTTTGGYLVVDRQMNAFVPQAYYTAAGYSFMPPQHALPALAQQYESPVASTQGYSAGEAQADVDALIDLVAYFNNQQEETNTAEVQEIANNLQNSLPSTPTTTQPDSPSMHSRLPGISSLSGEYASLSAQLFSSSVKKPSYPSSPTPVSQQPRTSAPSKPSVVLPSISLPSLPRPQPQQQRQAMRPPVPSPESSPCSSPPLSPKRSKKNYTKEFNLRFHDLLNNNEYASNEWHIYAQRHKGRCTIKRAPCIKVSRGFCASFGHEFTDLAKEEKYGALGTRTECGCMHKPQPLSSGNGPTKKQRQATRSSPYPTQTPSTPQEPELPRTPSDSSSPLTKQAWINFLLQSAPLLHEGFNNFMGGMQCSACHSRRAFASRDEVIAYLMREPIPCTHACCAGNMNLHQ